MKDPIDFHIRSLEQRLDDLTEEVAALTEENAKLLHVIEGNKKDRVTILQSRTQVCEQMARRERELLEATEDNKRLREALEAAYPILLEANEKFSIGGDSYDAALDLVESALHSDHPKS